MEAAIAATCGSACASRARGIAASPERGNTPASVSRIRAASPSWRARRVAIASRSGNGCAAVSGGASGSVATSTSSNSPGLMCSVVTQPRPFPFSSSRITSLGPIYTNSSGVAFRVPHPSLLTAAATAALMLTDRASTVASNCLARSSLLGACWVRMARADAHAPTDSNASAQQMTGGTAVFVDCCRASAASMPGSA